MTQFFLIHSPSKDEYAIKSIGLYHMYTRILRPEGADDAAFKDMAIEQFNSFIKKEQILDGEIIQSAYIF